MKQYDKNMKIFNFILMGTLVAASMVSCNTKGGDFAVPQTQLEGRFLKKKQPPSIHALLMASQNNMVSGLPRTIVKVMVCLP